MFHHFHDNYIHKKSQGSISRESLIKIIKFIGRENILDSNDFLNRLLEKKLENNKVCITFDDSLRCQLDVALPVLEDFKIKAFFFVYTSIFEDKFMCMLEYYRHFRNTNYKDINDFYRDFYSILSIDINVILKKNEKLINQYLLKFPFYSINDVLFKITRNNNVSEKDYKQVMNKLFQKYNYDPETNFSNLFMTKENIIKLNQLGHIVGLHSHNHSTTFEKLKPSEQKKDYVKNLSSLKNILYTNINTMSHPCGSYNENTLNILNGLNIELGFKNSMSNKNIGFIDEFNSTNLEIPREDSGNIINFI